MTHVDWNLKYRPRSFGQTIQGAEHAPVRDLISYERQRGLAHINLLTGPFGCGKSSTLNILLMCGACRYRKPNDYEPCGVCEGCQSAEAGGRGFFDFVGRLDVTQSSWKSEVRDNAYTWANWRGDREPSVTYRLAIDEFHILTEAEQWWLKEYMDHPSYAGITWLLATSDAGKVLPAIRSRAAVHEFSPPTKVLLVTWIDRILDSEGKKSERGAVELVVELCDRFPRRILKECQRMLLGRETLTAALVREHFGTQ